MSIGAAPSAMGANPQPAPTLPGDSKDAQYPKWIQLGSAQMGVGRGISLGNGTVEASPPSISEVSITKMTDSATPSLFTLACGVWLSGWIILALSLNDVREWANFVFSGFTHRGLQAVK